MSTANPIGVVIIGRNEGERLQRCIESVRTGGNLGIVYVDSGSTDGSPRMAREFEALVVELAPDRPFSAARARNAGFRSLTADCPDMEFVQFIDGDCELNTTWLDLASDYLSSSPAAGVACGQLTERASGESVYNRLCSLEWKGRPGAARSCGGIFMIRRHAFEVVGGFDETIIAGEEPELCVRLRAAGWSIWRLDAPMATHDAAMTRLGQWWKRTLRTGYGYANVSWRHRTSPDRPWRREVYRNWFWGLGLPLLIVGLVWPTHGLSLLVLGLYPIWAWRIARNRHCDFGDSLHDAWLCAAFCMAGKLPMALGQALFWWRRWRGAKSTVIEYKGPAEMSPPHFAARPVVGEQTQS